MSKGAFHVFHVHCADFPLVCLCSTAAISMEKKENEEIIVLSFELACKAIGTIMYFRGRNIDVHIYKRWYHEFDNNKIGAHNVHFDAFVYRYSIHAFMASLFLPFWMYLLCSLFHCSVCPMPDARHNCVADIFPFNNFEFGIFCYWRTRATHFAHNPRELPFRLRT